MLVRRLFDIGVKWPIAIAKSRDNDIVARLLGARGGVGCSCLKPMAFRERSRRARKRLASRIITVRRRRHLGGGRGGWA